MYLDDAKESMDKATKHLAQELTKIRAGKASPSMLDGLSIDYYGVSTPINQASAINTPDARTIQIRPFERKIISDIEKAIIDANLGFTPQNDGESIRINIPPLTEDRRRDLVKQVKNEGENGKVRVRNIRKDTNEGLRKLLKEGASEDDVKRAEEKVQKLTDEAIVKIDQLLVAKEAEIMTV